MRYRDSNRMARIRNGGLLQNDVTVPQDDAYAAKGPEDTSSLAMMATASVQSYR
jgi:hypothetical protein